MDQEEIQNFVENSFQEGYSIEEIQEVLMEEGVEGEKAKIAVQNLKRELKQEKRTQNNNRKQVQKQDKKASTSRNQRNTRSPENNQHKDVIPGVDLTDDVYTIKQRLFFNRYHIYDQSGNMVLKAKKKLFRLKEDFPMMNTNNETVAHVTAKRIVDAGGDYTLVAGEEEEPVAVLDRQYTLFRHKWKIRDPETEEKLAKVESSNKNIELIRWLGNLIPYFPNVFGLIPHKYHIKDQNGSILAELEGQLSIRDIYKLNIEKPSKAPKEALVASAIAIDALERN